MTALFFVVLIIVLLTVSGIAGLLLSALGWAVGGLIIGFLGRFMVKDSDRVGIGATILAGIAGSVAGGLIAKALSVDTWIIQFLIAILVAAAVMAITAASRRRY